jgi:CRISPR-associated endoribonuclease Cas6
MRLKVTLITSNHDFEINDTGEKFVEGILSKPEIRICGIDFIVSEVSVLPERKVKGREKLVTLSPIYASTSVGENGRRRIVDLYPKDSKFYELILQNPVKKYVSYYKRTPENLDFRMKPLNVKAKRIRLKDTYHRCVEMVFEAEGNPELLEVGYKAEFGFKNSMGFGMVKVV